MKLKVCDTHCDKIFVECFKVVFELMEIGVKMDRNRVFNGRFYEMKEVA